MVEVLAFSHTMNDDDVDFKPSQATSSNLTSLFNTNRPRSSDNQSLIYTAPKAPKAGESSTGRKESSVRSLSNEKLDIISTKNVQAHKLENGKYVNQGTTGLAIIGSYDWHIYQIILYKNKKDYLSKTHISPNFPFTVLENNYASFYDNTRQNWSILFSSPSDVQQFAKQVAIGKYNSQSKSEKVVIQDLVPPGTLKAKKNDILEVKYTCSVLHKEEVTLIEEDAVASIELAETNAFPWHEALKECSDKCKRIIILPYKLSAPWMDKLEPDCSVMVELEIQKIVSPESNQATASASQAQKGKPAKSKVQDGSQSDSSAEEDNCKDKNTSLMDSLFLTKNQKSNLISRIAKMGQALPLTFASAPSDSEEESTSPTRRLNRLRAVGNAIHQFHQSLPLPLYPCSPRSSDQANVKQPQGQGPGQPAGGTPGYKTDVPGQQQQNSGVNEPCQQTQPIPTGPQPSEASKPEKIQPSEPAATDAELRISINKVSQKVDNVLSKLQNMYTTSWDRVKEHQSTTILDPVSVISSIQGVMAENENLKDEIKQQKSKIDEQNKKIETLLNLTQRCVEQCALPDGRHRAGAERIAELEKRLNTSDQLMVEANARMSQLVLDAEKYRKEIADNQKCLRESTAQMQELVEKLKEREELLHNMEKDLVQTVAENETLININEEQKKEISRYKSQEAAELPGPSRDPQYTSSEDSFEEIKRVMNAVNRKLQSYFDSEKLYSGSEVKDTIAATIKDVTLEYLKYKSRQRSASKDIQQRESGSASVDVRKGSARAAPEPLAESEIVNAEAVAAEYDGRFKKQSDLGRVGSHRLTFVQDEASPNIAAREREDEGRKSGARAVTPQEASQMSTRMSSEPAGLARSLRSIDMVKGESGRASEDFQRASVEEGTQPQTRRGSSGLPSSLRVVDEDEDDAAIIGVSERGKSSVVGPPSDAVRGSTTESSSRKSTGTVLREPSAGDKFAKDEPLSSVAEFGSLNDDDETENVEIEKSTVSLSKTISEDIRDRASQPASRRSVLSSRDHGSGMDRSMRASSAAASSAMGRVVEEEGAENVEIEKSNVTLATTKSNVTRESKESTPRSQRQSSVNREEYSQLDTSIKEENEDDSGRTRDFDKVRESEMMEVEKSTDAPGSTSSSTTMKSQFMTPPSRRASESVREEASRLDENVKEDDGNSKIGESGTDIIDRENLSTASNVVRNSVTGTPPSQNESGMVRGEESGLGGSTKEEDRDVGSGRSETESVKKENASVTGEKSTVYISRTASNVNKDAPSQPASVRPSTVVGNQISDSDFDAEEDQDLPGNVVSNRVPSSEISTSGMSEFSSGSNRDTSSQLPSYTTMESFLKESREGVKDADKDKAAITNEGESTNELENVRYGETTDGEEAQSTPNDAPSDTADEKTSRTPSDVGLEEDGRADCNVQSNRSKRELDETNRTDETEREDETEGEGEDCEKNSVDKENSEEHIKTSGTNAVYDSCMCDDYYQNWGCSNPPPLPLGDEDSENDEEWL